MGVHSIPFSPELMDEEEERNRIAERAERIVQRLIEERRALFLQRCGSPNLIFPDGHLVSLSYGIGGALGDVERLLSAGSEPLGIVSAPED